eukprot:UN04949
MGCVLKYIDGEMYSERMLRAKIEARKHFTATFTVPIRPSFTGSATNVVSYILFRNTISIPKINSKNQHRSCEYSFSINYSFEANPI